ncbi:sulfotransferase family 2 domain-containing protein [Hansschlegelia plantiphila]|uniref:Sulfotransferase family protein n=1 Tax=Hansschlegelia plantiphila TaxID=374655 RepID=A0A9W6MTN1_9HYPH|nr:sulfotransferase family 2 domain-containing protein [Hansschlegelia plantiphila]GLK66504.1 hypothetical protein GCM10008179_01420 [Hansschlegelia plantiphila]
MIISYRHGFTFLHCPKTAGSSVNMYLAPHLGPLDIMLGARQERRRHGVRPNMRARLDALRAGRASGLAAVLGAHGDASDRVLRLQEKRYLRHFGPTIDHPNASQIRAFDERAWDRHFKFSFVRNPYARLVSMYFYLTRKTPETREPFPLFLQRLIAGEGALARWRHLIDQWPIYAIEDRLAVDFVGRYERLSEDFRVICGELGIPQGDLPHANAGLRYDFRDLYDSDSRARVGQVCGREIEHFEYCFHS